MLYNGEEKKCHFSNQTITYSSSFATLAKTREAQLHHKDMLKNEKRKEKKYTKHAFGIYF